MRVVILITASTTDTDPAKAQKAVDSIRSNVNKIAGREDVDVEVRDVIFCRLSLDGDREYASRFYEKSPPPCGGSISAEGSESKGSIYCFMIIDGDSHAVTCGYVLYDRKLFLRNDIVAVPDSAGYLRRIKKEYFNLFEPNYLAELEKTNPGLFTAGSHPSLNVLWEQD